MGRLPRVHQAGGIYHVILRGNNRKAIFFSEGDRIRWQQLLKRSIDRYDARVHCFCWMTNHVHLLVQVTERPLSSVVRYLASQYSRQTNFILGKTGHLFERRYRALLVSNTAYLLRLVRYIHHNPVRANLVSSIGDYVWISHPEYLGKRSTDWLTTDLVLGAFSDNRTKARLEYWRYIVDSDLDFDAYEQSTVDNDTPLDVSPAEMPDLGKQGACVSSLDQIINEHSAASGITVAQLTGASRARDITCVRADIAASAMDHGVGTMADVARALGRSESAINQLINVRKKRRRSKP